MHAHLRTALAAMTGLIAATGLMAAAPAPAPNDLRQFRVGMPVADLPATGYGGFTCADAPGHTLTGWADYASCPKDARGLHDVAFRYENSSNPLARINDDAQGTKVAGHPVRLTLLIGDDARVDGIRIATDPHTRLYLRKKAFLFAFQIRAHFGEDGWHCTKAAPHGDEEPVGGVFIDQRCEKTTATRHLMLHQELYRRAGSPLKDFVGGTQLMIAPAG